MTEASGLGATPVIVFICEHGAAKSVLAAAYFNKLAHKRGLRLRAIARGTHPDAEIAPKVARALQAEGLVPSDSSPTKLSAADLAGAVRVVAFSPLPPDHVAAPALELWEDVPPVSEDYGAARDAIVARVQRLLADIESERSSAPTPPLSAAGRSGRAPDPPR